MVSTTKELSVVSYTRNSGKGYAIMQGLQKSRADIIVWMDADLSIHPRNIIHCLDIMETSDCDIVIASKRHPSSRIIYPVHRRFLSFAFNIVVKMLFRSKISDTQCGFKVLRKKVISSTIQFVKGKRFAFDAEFLVRAERLGYKIEEAPISMTHRESSRVNFREIMIMAGDLIQLRVDLIRHLQPKLLRKPSTKTAKLLSQSDSPQENVLSTTHK